MIIPTVIQKKGQTERVYDIYSMLLENRIIFLNGEVNHESAGLVVAQLLHLAHADPKKDIQLYINSPGGSLIDAFAIHDTMQFIKPDVSTICVGMAASAGSFILAAGARGKRFALPNSEIMIHQPSAGTQGKVTDMEIHVQNFLKNKKVLNKLMAGFCGQDEATMLDAMERDNFMSALDAKEFGLIDEVVEKMS